MSAAEAAALLATEMRGRAKEILKAAAPPNPPQRSYRRVAATFGKARLHHYRPRGAVKTGPLLIVYGLVGRSSLVDLEERRSLVRALLDRGVDLYLIDWGEVTRADRFMAFDDYVCGPLAEAIAWLRAETGAPPSLLGVCEGGVFSAIYAALHPGAVDRLVLAITPIDFHVDAANQALAARIRALSIAEIDAMIDAEGLIPGAWMSAAFLRLDPARAMARFAVDLPAAANDPARLESFLQMETWLADRPDHPGAASRQWLVDLYHENRLAAGRLMIDGQKVDLAAIQAPVLNIYGKRDHIAPPASVRALGGLVQAPYREVAVDAGHAGVIVGRASQPVVAPAICEWIDHAG